jgi:hypothetical protein
MFNLYFETDNLYVKQCIQKQKKNIKFLDVILLQTMIEKIRLPNVDE